jgi:hypothetical protein
MTAVSAATAIFVVAALLYYQSHITPEGFTNVPADLNKAPVAVVPNMQVPGSFQRPISIPGAMIAPKEALATIKDLYELDNKITTWLEAASQRERENPLGLTPTQLQRRAMLQGRLAEVRRQEGTGQISDTAAAVNREIMEIRTENAGWQKPAPSLEDVYEFAKTSPSESFLSAEQYVDFRGLFQAGLQQLAGHTQPDPLQRVRLQQLQVIDQDLRVAERKFNPPPIRVSAARLFLQQMLKPEQPLPTLFSMEPNPVTLPRLSANPLDVIQRLKDIRWKLTVTYDPAEEELKRTVTEMLQRMESGEATEPEVSYARQKLVEFEHQREPMGYSTMDAGCGAPFRYDPNDLEKRAHTLCKQIHEAFPKDAEALGCTKSLKDLDKYEAETVINTVCDRLRTSVPTVSPAQFNCPVRPV